MAVRKVDGRFTKVRKPKTEPEAPSVEIAPNLPSENSRKMTFGNWVEVLALVVASIAAGVSLWQTRILIETIDTPYKANLQLRRIQVCEEFLVATRRVQSTLTWSGGMNVKELFPDDTLDLNGFVAPLSKDLDFVDWLTASKSGYVFSMQVERDSQAIEELINSVSGITIFFDEDEREEAKTLSQNLQWLLIDSQLNFFGKENYAFSDKLEGLFPTLRNDRRASIERALSILTQTCDQAILNAPE
ncbi:hypothetical protein TRP8649_01412 [Pelagimonas phthalicica]|uniref:Uncharacterized protein n=1 Tax=Pelagimonas phthalicica TaxID=1037362 RepID=A0A238J9P1_9RHOB|nr:hypothetical protein [Pelagimonas phthalicica]TDS94166.1 hypothetical protein CLV87_0660 [Pelagimonas phthalicica]SMX27309.1 hypothetical protein TRP8649_01412 [Pelagimonas phthalicica]